MTLCTGGAENTVFEYLQNLSFGRFIFSAKKEECSVSKTLVARSSLFIFVTRNTGTFLPEGKGLQASPALIWKFKKKCPIFGKKMP